VAPDLWPAVGDIAQLHQVLMSLCANARDAMPGGGTLTLSARNAVEEGKHYVIVEVHDTGAGIEAELLDRIFEPFFTTKDVGHGLGLSTALSIAKSHGGSMERAVDRPNPWPTSLFVKNGSKIRSNSSAS